jgi:hypothetical protein
MDSLSSQKGNVLGLFFSEWPSLEIAARQDNPKRTESPKKTTAFNRTQTVCMLAAGIAVCFKYTRLSNEVELPKCREEFVDVDCRYVHPAEGRHSVQSDTSASTGTMKHCHLSLFYRNNFCPFISSFGSTFKVVLGVRSTCSLWHVEG